MSLFNMVARFTDENILKAQLASDNNDEIIVTVLDENGDEVECYLTLKSYPSMKYKLVNTQNAETTVSVFEMVDYRLTNGVYNIPAGGTVVADSIFGTQDGTTWMSALQSVDGTATASELVNCTQYGPYLIITDPSKDASVTMTIS